MHLYTSGIAVTLRFRGRFFLIIPSHLVLPSCPLSKLTEMCVPLRTGDDFVFYRRPDIAMTARPCV
ncbi:hypothetical protein FDX06_05475 [Citrobacter sp. wls618]|nr:hypothetical protein MC47_004235 [Citrobacter freundii]AVH83781.1 hypothetical protein A6J81_25505 [Citrobacter braakii]MBY1060025.1 hypothetical protein [Citrobacter europaeus]TKU25536.1 hypothetical protein FDW99_16975 [Citrobacter sp. wls758]TKU25575.1 hypothetical protein FDW87_00545 [Citrobacter sp. wls826]TKU63627.1 hypothetical protein FDX10_15500 [Citrobacter sp. wls713]TKU89751.1 hypothetical protein FDW90_17330 [Citrobacter sp. wls620]TKU99686.1 hypothetical protein FDX07_13020 